MSWADTRDGGRHHGPFGLFRRITGLSWPDLPVLTRMRRVALVAPGDALRDVLVRVADAAAVELGPPAGETAAAAGALRAVEAEALATRYRLRAVKNRWIPRLEQALADVTLALEEQELADSARLRLSARSGRAGGPWR